jgi:DNA-binding winged helix-turn-helix (wHTH) protein
MNMTAKVRAYAFDDFVLDLNFKTLMYRSHRVPLTPKAFHTLTVLLANQGKVVEKEQFLKEVWSETFVEESTLAQNIRTLRKTLTMFSPEKEFIVTVPRLGYRFVTEVRRIANVTQPE